MFGGIVRTAACMRLSSYTILSFLIGLALVLLALLINLRSSNDGRVSYAYDRPTQIVTTPGGEFSDNVERPGSPQLLDPLSLLSPFSPLNPPRTDTPTTPPSPTPIPTQTGTPTTIPPCGEAWRIVDSPNQGGGLYDSSLFAVGVVASDDIWAVGTYHNGYGRSRTLTMHWDGVEWTIVPSPSIGSECCFNSGLGGVTALATNDVWAVGNQSGGTLILHWDGIQWSVIPSPSLGAADILNAVDAVAPNDIWAVGATGPNGNSRTLVLHWDGSVWTIVSSPSPGDYNNGLNGVSVRASNDVWAVGNYFNGGCCAGHTLTMHWNGTSWTVVPSPNPGGSYYFHILSGVEAIAANDVWAVGEYDQGSSQVALTMHWNGTAWSVVPNPAPQNTYLNLRNVTARSASDVWVVGSYLCCTGDYLTLVLHWDGAAWSKVGSPSLGEFAELFGVAVASDGVWAAGYWAVNRIYTLVERYSDPCAPTPTTPPTTPTNTPTATPTVCGSGSNYVYATATATIVPGTTDIGNHCDDCTTTITLPFPFRLYGQTYTSVTLDSNGKAHFAGGATEPTSLCLPAAQYTYTIFPYWADLYTANPGYGIFTSVSGTAPNRIFNIEWRTEYWPATLNANFELRLYEDPAPYESKFEVIFGSITGIYNPGTSGVQGSGGLVTQYVCNGYGGDTWGGRLVTFYQPACGPPPPTSTSTSTSTPTTMPSSTTPPASTPTGTLALTRTPTSLPVTVTSTAVSTPSRTAGTSTPATSPTVVTATSTTTPTCTATHVVIGTPPTPPTATPCPIEFSDVPPGSTFYQYVRCLVCRGIVSGYADGTFRPNNDMTRGQVSKTVANAAGFNEPVEGQTFSDVPPNHTFYEYIERMARRGIISGYNDGTFRPGNPATRGQICKIVANAAGFNEPVEGQMFTDVPPNHTFYEYIERMASRGIVVGYNDGTFRPQNNATRGQVSKIVANTFFPNCQTPDQNE